MTEQKKRINIELLLSLSATFLSLAALIVAIFQTKIAREQQQKSVMPYLQIRHQITDSQLQIILENKGVGPAFIKYTWIKHNEKGAPTYEKFLVHELAQGEYRINQLQNISGLNDPKAIKQIKTDSSMTVWYDWYHASKDGDIVEPETALKEGDQVRIYDWRARSTIGGPFVTSFQQVVADSTYQIEIVYSDVYDNCWQLIHKLNRNKVIPLASCTELVQPKK